MEIHLLYINPGRNAKKVMEDSREKVATAINAEANEIVFTGSGTESNNMAIRGAAHSYKHRGNHIITSKIEHPSVLETCEALEKEGFELTYINADENGIIKLDELEKAITDKTIMITIMYANNEIGTIQPMKEIGLLAKKKNIIFHTDAVQAVRNVRN